MSIASDKARIENAVESIKSAISAKGTTVPGGTKIDGLAALISAIPSGAEVSAGECVSSDIMSITFSGLAGKSNYFFGLISASEISGQDILWSCHSGNAAISGEINIDETNIYQSSSTITKSESGSDVTFTIGDTDPGIFVYGGTYKCWAW